jgi:NitT/TauT family transport system ATP-binding protein
MDEPFSALDVLTAETLRTDFLELWDAGQMPIKGVIMVTHNIEEAVLMSDRVLVFSTNPGRIASEIRVELPHPRNRHDPGFRDLVEKIYVEMTANVGALRHAAQRLERYPTLGLGSVLPRVGTNIMAGLLETVAAPPYFGKADLPVIAPALHMEIDDIFPVAETLQMLRFGWIEGGDIQLSDEGRHFADADLAERKQIFARHLLNYVPLIGHIKRVLDERETHVAPMSRFSDELEDHMSEEFAHRTLRTAIAWGRYAELFAYNDQTARFTLENPT